MSPKASESWQECLKQSMSLLIINESYDQLCEVMAMPYTKVSKAVQSLKKHQKRKKAEQLSCLLRRFLFMCNSSKERISSSDRVTFDEIMSRYISILIQVSFLSRESDEKQKCEVIMTTLLLYLKHSPEHMVDAVLRVVSYFQTDSFTFADIFWKLLSLSREMMDTSLYLKCLLLTKCWTLYLTCAQRRPFIKSAKSLPIEKVSKKTINRHIVKCGLAKIVDKNSMTNTLLKCFKPRIVESLLKILYEDINDSGAIETQQTNEDLPISTNGVSAAEPEFAWFEDRKGIENVEKTPLEEEDSTGTGPQGDFVKDADSDSIVQLENDSGEKNQSLFLDPDDSVKHLRQDSTSPLKIMKITNVISLSPGRAGDFECDVPVRVEDDVNIKSPTNKLVKENGHKSKMKTESEPAVIEDVEDEIEDDDTESESDSNDSVEDDDSNDDDDVEIIPATEEIKIEDDNDKIEIKDDVMEPAMNGSSNDEEVSGNESESSGDISAKDKGIDEIDNAETKSSTKEDEEEDGNSGFKDAETEPVLKEQLEDEDSGDDDSDTSDESSTDDSTDEDTIEIDDSEIESATKEEDDGNSKIKHAETEAAIEEPLEDDDIVGDESDSSNESSTYDSAEDDDVEIDDSATSSATKEAKKEDDDGNCKIKHAEIQPATKESLEDEVIDIDDDTSSESITVDSENDVGELDDVEIESATKSTKNEDDDGKNKVENVVIEPAVKEPLEDDSDDDDDTSSESSSNDVENCESGDAETESDAKEEGDNNKIEPVVIEPTSDFDNDSSDSAVNDLEKDVENCESDSAKTEPAAKEEDDNNKIKDKVMDPAMNELSEEKDDSDDDNEIKDEVMDPAVNEPSEEEDDSDDETDRESTADGKEKDNDSGDNEETDSAKMKASEELMKDAVNEPLSDDDASENDDSEGGSTTNDLVGDDDDSEDDDAEFEAATKQLAEVKNGKFEKVGVTSATNKPVKDESENNNLQKEMNVNQHITDDENEVSDVDIETESVISKPLKDVSNSEKSPKPDYSIRSVCKVVKVELLPLRVSPPVSKSPCVEIFSATPKRSKSPKRARLVYESSPMTRKRLKSLDDNNEIIQSKPENEVRNYPNLPTAADLRRRSLRPRKASETDEDTEKSKNTEVLDVISETQEQATFDTGSQKFVKKTKEVGKVLKRTSMRSEDVNTTREAQSVSPKNKWSPKRLRTRVIHTVDVVRVKSVGRKQLPNKNISTVSPVGTLLLEMSGEESDHANFSEQTAVNDGDVKKWRGGSSSPDSNVLYHKNSCTPRFHRVTRAGLPARRSLIYSSSECSSVGSPPRNGEDNLHQNAFSTPSSRSSSGLKKALSKSSTPKKREKSKFLDNLPRNCKTGYHLRPAKSISKFNSSKPT